MTTRGKRTRKLIQGIALVAIAFALPFVSAADAPWSTARQMILVISPDWQSSHATLHAYERKPRGWRSAADPIPVAIGRTGSAWGIGLHPAQTGVQKQEGDGRSPAGVFALGSAFGYAQTESIALPYAAMDSNDYCIDVPASPLYNRIVDAREVGAAAIAGSTEPMRLDLHADGDQRYKLGFVIEHNPQGVKGSGSCIFAHLWKSADSSTAGCTAMTEPAMRALVAWLQPPDHPVFVLLPRGEYERLKDEWKLPPIASDAATSR